MAQLHTESSGPFFAQLGIGSTGTIFAQLHLGHWERRLLNRTLGHADRSLLGRGCNDGENSFTVAALKTRSKSSPTRPGRRSEALNRLTQKRPGARARARKRSVWVPRFIELWGLPHEARRGFVRAW
jgi:hypothetical protein